MNRDEVIRWLLQSDVSLQFQVYRDLLSERRKDLQHRIASEGWGAELLSRRKQDGHWGQAFYQPKWTSTHYTLLDLRNLCISPDHETLRHSIDVIIATEKAPDGGIKPIGSHQGSDLCINGMFLNYASYLKTDEEKLKSIVDCILSQVMPDGGFNCRSNRSGAVHSSMHTTLSVLEGITEYQYGGYTYRLEELKEAADSSVEFLLLHQLFISDRTGEIINKDFLRFSYPRRWRYDILSALDYLCYAKVPWDDRMAPALTFVLQKRTANGTWKLRAKHAGQTHFEMEQAGKPSRWNTLRAMRVLDFYGTEERT